MVLCQKKETEVVNFVRKDDHLVVHRAQHHMPHGGGGRRAGRVPVLRFRGAAARGAPVCSVSRRARVGGPGPAPHVRVSRGWVFFPGNESRARHRPGSCADASPSAAASIPFGAFTAARRSRCRLRLSVSGDRGLLPAGLDR